MTLLAQLSDLHLRADGGDPCHDPARALHAAFEVIAGLDLRPEAILMSGDVIDRSAPDYSRALALLRAAPVALWPMPGNHDRPEAFRAAFADWAPFAVDHLSFTQRIGPMRLVALDSNLAGGKGGVDPLRLDWLARVLAESDAPVLLALHHPPFATGLPHLDRQGFAGAEDLARLVAGSAICRVIAGHAHRGIRRSWAGVEASVAPALGHGLGLSFAGAKHLPAPGAPGFELHDLRGATEREGPLVISHQITLATD
ncbi:metallophosphoesterase [Paracoccus aminophilus]|uniref:Metallophosphoesterase n=1 Tax=Paracoccus aminophilus JCM 7686 TaxID=1367847 RepID=S5Z0G3_PARAH|nr:metallophosphoesterase [Paracoccus aminophilus]AGT10956.1 metallophosphoesterase [Paracoccus aminophilus JCM 7686]